jgi:hypothetical protein
MDTADTQLRSALRDLREAGTRAVHASGSATSDAVPDVLVELERTLRELSALSYSLGDVVVPGAPSASHERKAMALSKLHETGASIGASARRCRAAMEAVAPLAGSVSGGTHASPPSTTGRAVAA